VVAASRQRGVAQERVRVVFRQPGEEPPDELLLGLDAVVSRGSHHILISSDGVYGQNVR
jgi:hypothetical protein